MLLFCGGQSNISGSSAPSGLQVSVKLSLASAADPVGSQSALGGVMILTLLFL